MSTLPYAISTHLYHNERLSRDHLVEIAAHGFERVELFANRPHLDVTDERLAAEVQEGLADTGLTVQAVHAPIAESLVGGTWGPAFSIASGDERARATAVAAVEGSIRFAARLQVPFVVVHAGVPDAQHPAAGDNRLDALRRSLEALHDVAESTGVTLALEVMPNRLSSADSLVRLVEDDLELPHLAICLDLGHAHLMGDLVDAIETVSGHVVTTHVHDNAGRTDDHRLPFEGRIPWDAALMALQKIGYDGALVFELAASADTRAVLERAARVRERFDALLGASAL